MSIALVLIIDTVPEVHYRVPSCRECVLHQYTYIYLLHVCIHQPVLTCITYVLHPYVDYR
jgi:hypothetical protein